MVLKKQKTPENSRSRGNNNVCVGEDKISNLPDALILHILSFLPSKCVMSTSILSKRWKPLSNSIPTIDFREWRPRRPPGGFTNKGKRLKAQQFMSFLDRVFHENRNIQKLCLTLDDLFDETRINKWISIVVTRKVKELFLSRGVGTPSIFPLSFFTCDSLKVLEFEGVKLDVPNTVSFPSLKLLRLRDMQFVNEISIERLISNCPILEDCSIVDNCFMFEVLCIANVALKNLDIGIRFSVIRESTVKICAPNLSTISYGLEVPVDFVFDSFPSLVEADINIYCDGYYRFETSVVIKLFEKLSNVKLLKMSGESFTVLSEAEILLTDSPAFNNLIHLEVSSKFNCTSLSFDYYSFSTVRILFRFLQMSPYLESIVFAKGIYSSDEDSHVYSTDEDSDVRCTDKEDDVYCTDEEDDDFWSVDPECSLLHLKSIIFKDYDRKPIELNAIKFFLKYAKFLETVTIVASPELSDNNMGQTKAMRQIMKLPKPINCVVKFMPNS